MNAVSTSTVGATVALILAGGAAADNGAPSDAQLRYQQERAACFTGQFIVDRETCLREAGAALLEARHGGLTGGSEREFEQNRLIRCQALPPSDREDCARRMSGEGSATGSVEQGGILRELTRTLPPASN